MKRRKTIGFLVDFFAEDYQAEILQGIKSETEKLDINLICFCGGPLNSPKAHHHPRNAVYDLVGSTVLDGIVLLGGSIGNFVSLEKLKDFYRRFSSLPIVSIGVDIEIEGIPSLIIDNEKGMRSLVEHLITEHKYERIAVIRGTEGNSEAEIRFKAYRDVLEQFHIPFDPELICPGTFYYGSGEDAVSMLIDERHARFDALIGCNDLMTLEAMRELQKRGIHIPHDAAIGGFDDIEECRFTCPPLTTVRQPLFKIGEESVKTLTRLIGNEKVEAVQNFPAEIIPRRSCGCFGQRTYFIIGNRIPDRPPVSVLPVDNKILHDIFLAAIDSKRVSHMHGEWVDSLEVSLLEAIKTGNGDPFINEFERILLSSYKEGFEILEWSRIMREIIRKVWDLVASGEYIMFFTSLTGRIEEIIGEHNMEQLFIHKKQSNVLTRALHILSIELITTFSLSSFTDIIDSILPSLGISYFYIAKYLKAADVHQIDADVHQLDADEQENVRMYIAYKDGKLLKLNPSRHTCPKKNLMPEICYENEKRFSFLVMALSFKEEQIGYVIYNIAPLEGLIYETLTVQLSSALMGAQLVNEIEETQKEVLYTLGDMLEARSFETGSHVKRVAEYSYLLAVKYGLSEDDAELLRLASPMHDIGKLAIGESILEKPGPLVTGEFEIVKAHTSIGYEIFKASERKLLQTAAVIAHQHHERWDGTGYPRGLKGEEIHIFGRITCISDVFDALGNNRVYKKEWPIDQILNYILEQKGKLFDPKLVDLFFEYIDELLIIRASF